MIFLFANFAESELAGPIEAGDTLLQLPPSDAALFPVPTSGTSTFALILYDGAHAPEIVWVDVNSLNGNFTVVRAREGTTARRWLTGTRVILGLTKASVGYFSSGGSQTWIDTLNARVDDAFAAISNEATVRADGISAEADLREELDASVGTYRAQVVTVAQAFADLNSAVASYQIDITAQADAATAQALESFNASVANGQALADFEISISATIDGNVASLQHQIDILVDDNEAQVTVTDSLRSDLGDASAALDGEITVRATQYGAFVDAITIQQANYGDLNAGLISESLTRADEDGALSIRIDSVIATYDADFVTINARVDDEEIARADSDDALAADIVTVHAEIVTETSDRVADVSAEASARVSADAVNAADIVTVHGEVVTEAAARTAAVSNEASLRITADAVNAADIVTVHGEVLTEASNRTAAVSNEASLRIAADGVNAADIVTVHGQVVTETSNRVAAVSNEASIRITDDATNAADILTVSTTVAGHTTSISVAATAITNLEAQEDIAKYVVEVAASGGNPAILSLYSDGQGNADIAIQASYIFFGDNTVFDDTLNTFTTTWTGAQRVQTFGDVFGGADELVEWYGPDTVLFADMSKANAQFFISQVPPYIGGSALDAAQAPAALKRTEPFSASGGITAGTTWSSLFNFTMNNVPADPHWDFVVQYGSYSTSDGFDFNANWRFLETDTFGTSVILPCEGVQTYNISGGDPDVADVATSGIGTKTGTVTVDFQVQRNAGTNYLFAAAGNCYGTVIKGG